MRFLSQRRPHTEVWRVKKWIFFYILLGGWMWKWMEWEWLFKATISLRSRSRSKCDHNRINWELPVESYRHAKLNYIVRAKQRNKSISVESRSIKHINNMTNQIYPTNDYSILNASVRYDDVNGSYPYMNYGSTEASINATLNETWVILSRELPLFVLELFSLPKHDSY